MNYSFIKLIPKNYFNSFILLIFFLFITSIIEIIGIGMIPIFVSFLIDPSLLSEKININFINNFLNNNDSFSTVLTGSVIICFTFLFKNIFV